MSIGVIILGTILIYALYQAILNEPLFFKTVTYVFKKTQRNFEIASTLDKIPKYRPNFFLPGPLTKLLLVFRPKGPIESHYDRQIFTFEDGGKVALDFYPKKSILLKKFQNKEKINKIPLVILVPGLSGNSTDRYLLDTCRELWREKGYRTMIANRRGYAGMEICCKYPMSWIRYEDVDAIIHHLMDIEETKECNLYLMGYSLGGNFVYYYTGRKQELDHDFHIKGAIAVSAPHEMYRSLLKIQKNVLIDKTLVGGLKNTARSHKENKMFLEFIESKGLTIEDFFKVKTLYEFDDKITSKWYGKEDALDYYNHFSANRRIQHVSIPLLSINSMADPDTKKILNNENVFQVNVRDGGHVTYPHGICNKNYAAVYAANWISFIEKNL